MNRRFGLIVMGVILLGAGAVAWTIRERHAADNQFRQQAELSARDAARARTTRMIYSREPIAAGGNFTTAVMRLGVDPSEAAQIAESARQAYDLRRIRAGNVLAVGRSVTGELRAVRYQIDPDRMLEITPRDGSFAAAIAEIPSRTETVTVGGEVRDSLFGAVADAGESPELAMRLSQIFGWDLDFYTDPRQGDTFRVVLERKTYREGNTSGYGRILAAEYTNDGHPYQAVLFHDRRGNPAYYSPEGKSLQKAFLRSPLKFSAPITSRFSRNRFHPILKRSRPHLGIDYGAPTGTPVQATGAGRVVFAGRKGGDGNMVRLAHSRGYETLYLHLSRILVRAGQRVEQGQRIGLVGMTGLATGPHLDFRIVQHGVFKNFLALQLPPSEPVAPSERDEFAAARDQWMPMLGEAPSLNAGSADAESIGD